MSWAINCAWTDAIVELVIQIAKDAKRFFSRAVNWYEGQGRKSNGRCHKNFIDDNMSGHLKDLRGRISQLANETKDVDEQFELVRLANRCASLVQDMESFLTQLSPSTKIFLSALFQVPCQRASNLPLSCQNHAWLCDFPSRTVQKILHLPNCMHKLLLQQSAQYFL